MNLKDVVKNQKNFFEKNITKSINYRKRTLKNLEIALNTYQDRLMEAVKKDFGKCYEETYISEILMVKKEISYMLKNLTKFSRISKVKTGIFTFPSQGYILPEPYGVVLIATPWNYPINLSLTPLVGAIAAGNCSIISFSDKLSYTSRVIKQMLSNIFEEEYVYVLTNANVNDLEELISEKLDYIFFTGSTNAGKNIMKLASSNLTPVTLELGGKNPVILGNIQNLESVAQRIVWGKFLNAGQTCVAPDYMLLTKKQKDDLVPYIKKYIEKMYYKNGIISNKYTKIINEGAFDRLNEILKDEKILIGGQTDRQNLIIEPTVVEVDSLEKLIMQDEIFGPILAIVEINSLNDAIGFVNSRPKPLAIYLFADDKTSITKVINETSSGSICINDTIMQLSEINLPFGGVGNSGFGSYHGKKSFETFSHYKSILKRNLKFEINLRYPPYSDKLLRKLKHL